MIAYLLIKTSRNLKGQLDKELKKLGVTSAQFSVMNQVDIMGNHARSYEIASNLGSDRPTISAIIQRLTNAGILIRIPNDNDRRTQYIELTDKGKKLLAESRFIADNLSKNIFEHLDENSKRNFIKELEFINERLVNYNE